MIETYADKYSKDKIILPQNMTIMNSLSFTDFKDLESNLGFILCGILFSIQIFVRHSNDKG